YPTPMLYPPMVSTKIACFVSAAACGTPASPINCPERVNSEKIEVPFTVPAVADTAAKPGEYGPVPAETYFLLPPAGIENVMVPVVGVPTSSTNVTANAEPAPPRFALSRLNVIVPLAVAPPAAAGFVRKIVVFQIVLPRTPLARCGK